jgi:hypothetical protein
MLNLQSVVVVVVVEVIKQRGVAFRSPHPLAGTACTPSLAQVASWLFPFITLARGQKTVE